MKRSIPIWIAGAVALVVIAAAGYWFGIRPKRAEVAKLDGEIAALQTQISAASKIASGPDGSGASAIRVADLVRLAKAMPDELDMPGIILELNSAATAAGVTFTAITPSTPVSGSGYTAIPISLTFEGSYYELTELLFQLRNLVTVRDGVLDADGRLFSIDAISLQEGTEGFPQVQAALTVSAYQFGVDASTLAPAAAATAAPAAATTSTTDTTQTTTEPATTTQPPPPADQPADVAQAQGGTP